MAGVVLLNMEVVRVERLPVDVVDLLVLMTATRELLLVDVLVGGLLEVVEVEVLIIVVVMGLLDDVIIVVGAAVVGLELAFVSVATTAFVVVETVDLPLELVVLATTTASAVLTAPVPPANGLIGGTPGKKLAGIVGIGIDTVYPGPGLCRSYGMVAAENPLGAADTVVVLTAYDDEPDS